MDPVEEIKGRLSIEVVVGRYVDLKRSGASFKGLCPFHQEKTPSFYVTPSRGTYHCFGCGRGGDLFSFVQEADRLTFPEALKQLADQAGVTLPERERDKPSQTKRLYEVNEEAARYFRDALRSAQGERARRYLQGRGFGREAADMFELGYAPEGRDALSQHLRKAGFDDRLLLAAGLALQDEIGGKFRDRFHGRLIFPIRDASGKVRGFGGRTMGDAQPKYLNSPQTEIFDKSATLYGIHRAQDAIRQARRAVLVEGYLDAIRAHLGGFLNTVASLGTAVTVQQLSALSRLTDTVILALDPDPAGQAAAARTSLTALAEVTRARGRATGASGALDLRVARLPEGHGDPDELIRDHPERWEEALNSSVPAFEFYFAQTIASLDRSSDTWRQDAIDRLLPVIQQFATSVGWQATWLERLAAETGVDLRLLQQSIPGARPAPGRAPAGPRRSPSSGDRAQSVVSGTTARAAATDPILSVERALVALLLQQMVVPDVAAGLLDPAQLEGQEHRAILERLLAWRQNENYDYEMFRDTLAADLRPYADELRAMDLPPPEDGKLSVAVEYHLARVRQFRLQRQLTRTQEMLQDMAAADRQEAVSSLARLMTERLEVEQELERLSQRAVQWGAAPLGSGHD